MAVKESKTTLQSGGSFILPTENSTDIFISEEFTEEQSMIRESCVEFISREVEPIADLIDSQKDLTIAPTLLEKTGELGLLGIGVPEEFGGIEMDFVTALSNSEILGGSYSFALTIGVQTSIGIAPILLYGNDQQKAQYLPDMVTGEVKGCYCLTEPDSGSDANSGKTRAKIIEDGQAYLLDGQKMWITNAGFADLFIVFAKIEDDRNLSAFIVEKNFGGISLGEEEKKMGIKGSSTRQVFFNGVRVPAENLLGERNKGFKIALNVLNTGRIKLAASALGVGKKTLGFATKYAIDRKQFGKSISEFGAIQEKLAKMAVKLYALDAALYRTAHQIDQTYDYLLSQGMDATQAKSASVEAYAIECALLKVFGSEAQGYIVDEGVQIYGGMGFSADTPMDKLYRDARIARIFEGTNEINRMLSVDLLLKKAMKGKLDLMAAIQQVQNEVRELPKENLDTDNPVAVLRKQLINLKKGFLFLTGAAVQKLMLKLKSEQEILLRAADILIHLYMLDSAILKTEKLVAQKGLEACSDQILLTQLFAYEAQQQIRMAGEEIIYAFADEESIPFLQMGLSRFGKNTIAINLKNARRTIAQKIISTQGWGF